MKSYTDIEQSRKLAEILPVESADAWWAERYEGKVTYDGQYIVNEEPYYYISFIKPSETNYSQDTIKDIPCWSLSALLNALPVSIDDGRHCLALINSNPSGEIEWLCCYEDDNGNTLMECYADNQIDACVEMILKTQRKRTMTRAEKLEEAKRLYETANADQRYVLESLFPELKESEDERIRKGLVKAFGTIGKKDWGGLIVRDILAWLEKQGEQKQTWKPTEAQLIVIKDLIEDKNTSKVNKVILRGMLDELKQYFGL